jgi:hypothetical protein
MDLPIIETGSINAPAPSPASWTKSLLFKFPPFFIV